MSPLRRAAGALLCAAAAVADKLPALHMAAKNGHVGKLEQLLDDGASSSDRDDKGRTALYFASFSGHVAAAKWLLADGAEVGAKSDDGNTPFLMAAYFGHTPLLQVLAKAGADLKGVDGNGWSALMVAAHKGRDEAVTWLAEQDPEAIHASDSQGKTAVHYAALEGHIGALTALAVAGADLNRADIKGILPLTLAVIKKHDNAATVLLAARADPTLKAKDKDLSPLAIMIVQGKEDLVKAALEHKAVEPSVVAELAGEYSNQAIKKIAEAAMREEDNDLLSSLEEDMQAAEATQDENPEL